MLQVHFVTLKGEKSIGNRTILGASFQGQHNRRAMPATKFQTTPSARSRLPWVPKAIGPLGSPVARSRQVGWNERYRRLAAASHFSTTNGPRVVKPKHADTSAFSKRHPLLLCRFCIYEAVFGKSTRKVGKNGSLGRRLPPGNTLKRRHAEQASAMAFEISHSPMTTSSLRTLPDLSAGLFCHGACTAQRQRCTE